MQAAGYRLKPGPCSSHGRILAFLRRFPAHTRILDVGTSTGYVGAALREQGFEHLCGIEVEPEAAAHARPFYDPLVVTDVERDRLPWADGSFDVVICADVLEHLREPERALQRISPLVAPGGWLLVSVPNIAHWSMRVGLLLGRFQYTTSGLLDRSHVRFFTRASARALVHGAGLTIRQETATPLPIAHWCNGSAWTPIWRTVEHIDGWLGWVRPSLFAYQFLLITQRAQAP